MRKKIDKIHEMSFGSIVSGTEALNEMNQWIEDSPDDIVVINVQCESYNGHVSVPIEGIDPMSGVMAAQSQTRWIYRLFYGIKDKEI